MGNNLTFALSALHLEQPVHPENYATNETVDPCMYDFLEVLSQRPTGEFGPL